MTSSCEIIEALRPHRADVLIVIIVTVIVIVTAAVIVTALVIVIVCGVMRVIK